MSGVTLYDVAREAGVSHTTVSWALRGDSRICAATRERVQAVATRLGYVPNATARSLASGRTATIALVSPAFSAAYESELLRGIEEEMTASHPDYELVQYSTAGNPERAQSIWDRLLRGNRADAAICLCDPPPLAVRKAYARAGRPLVLFDERIEDTSCVRGDGRLGTRLAVQRLLERGCRRPAIVTSASSQEERPRCDPDRLGVFRELCTQAGLKAGHLVVECFRFEAGQTLAQNVAREGWDGIFCAAGDLVAAGLLAGLRPLGVNVPQEVRVIGYDDQLVASLATPPLTTVAQPLSRMGRAAVELCFSLLEAPAPKSPRHLRFEPSLVVRQSA